MTCDGHGCQWGSVSQEISLMYSFCWSVAWCIHIHHVVMSYCASLILCWTMWPYVTDRIDISMSEIDSKYQIHAQFVLNERNLLMLRDKYIVINHCPVLHSLIIHCIIKQQYILLLKKSLILNSLLLVFS